MRRFALMVAAVGVLLLPFTAAHAGVLSQATGSGTLHNNGGTFWFVAFSDLRGTIIYDSVDGLHLHCDQPTVPLAGYTGKVTKHGYNDAEFGSNDCYDPQNNLYRVWIDAMDRGNGENGKLDKVTVRVYKWPSKTLLIEERGSISSGSVLVTL